jgi:NAD(P)-dependent dehydrogenase (short-subunit alcohol dehydrogenase family)
MNLQDTVALVTGAGSGLGSATSRALVARGATVVGADLPSAVEAGEPQPGVTLVGCDVTEPEQVRAAVDAAASTGLPLRTVVSCAGVVAGARLFSRHGAHDLGLFFRTVNINLVGSFYVMAVAAEEIAKTTPDENGQRGVVVHTASIAAFDGQIGQVAYAASKAGVVGLTLPAARDLAQYGIRVCTVAPGIIDTPMMAAVDDEFREVLAANVPFPHRLGTPEEFAGLVMAIIENDYLNGETIRMDGALRMGPR